MIRSLCGSHGKNKNKTEEEIRNKNKNIQNKFFIRCGGGVVLAYSQWHLQYLQVRVVFITPKDSYFNQTSHTPFSI